MERFNKQHVENDETPAIYSDCTDLDYMYVFYLARETFFQLHVGVIEAWVLINDDAFFFSFSLDSCCGFCHMLELGSVR